jgi:hypothetical protein
VFWSPTILAAVVPFVSIDGRISVEPQFRLCDFPDFRIERAADGWHGVLNRDGVDHRAWFASEPRLDAYYAAHIPFDDRLEARAHAAMRLWRALTGRAPIPLFGDLPQQRKNRYVQALQALDGHLDGADYRDIAIAVFGRANVPDRGWNGHDLRSKTIRLVDTAKLLMAGGYRDLLTYPKKFD